MSLQQEPLRLFPTAHFPRVLLCDSYFGNRGADKSWNSALSPNDLEKAVQDNLQNLGLKALDVVNLRVGGTDGPTEGSIAEPLTVLVDLQRQGLIRLGSGRVQR